MNYLKRHLALHLLELAVMIVAISLSTVIVLNTKRDENQMADSLLEPPPFNGHLYSVADVESDLQSLECDIVTFTDLHPESSIFLMSNYTNFRRIAYNTKYVLMKIEQTAPGAKETVHMFSTYDGTLFQHSIQFEVLLTLEEDCLWQQGTITVFIRNSGKSYTMIEEVYINSEQIQDSDWICAPSMIVESDGGTVTIVIAYSWEPNEAYNFMIYPNFGEALEFHETAPPSDEEEPPPSPYEKLEMTACSWNWGAAGSRTVEVTVENTGTKEVTVNYVEINHVGVSSSNVSPQPPFFFATTDSALHITITYDYTNGSSYDISIVTSSDHEFTDHFTGGQDENGHTVTSAANLGVMAMRKYNSTAYIIDVKNLTIHLYVLMSANCICVIEVSY